MIIFNSFSYTYPGSSSPALHNINLSLDKADFVVITGPSGCGKSTLAHCLCGFLKEGKHSGKIFLDGKDVMNLEPYKLTEKIGLVQQDPDAQLCTLTVEDELAFGLENLCYPIEEIEKRLDWSLGVVRGQYLRHRDTLTLSGGETHSEPGPEIHCPGQRGIGGSERENRDHCANTGAQDKWLSGHGQQAGGHAERGGCVGGRAPRGDGKAGGFRGNWSAPSQKRG
jgi:hypothetical protein